MTLSQIQSKIYFLTKTNSTSFTNATMLVLLNNAYERVASLIMQTDSRWQWDDNNNTNFPIATTNLVSDQQDYELATTHLKIHRVECAVDSSASNWNVLDIFDYQNENESLTYLSTQSGIPYRYDQIGASIFLYPKPNFNCTNGLKVYFQRGPLLWTSSDLTTGTILPGFNSLYHDLIALWVAYEYALANGLKNINAIFAEIDRKEKSLKDDYNTRNPSDRKIMSNKKILYI